MKSVKKYYAGLFFIPLECINVYEYEYMISINGLRQRKRISTGNPFIPSLAFVLLLEIKLHASLLFSNLRLVYEIAELCFVKEYKTFL